MSALFLSHASSDAAQALELKRRLLAAGYREVFLSSDGAAGIAAGADWERALYAALRESRAVVALCSPASEASRWCFAEITQARALRKPVFPVLLGVDGPPAVLRGVHAARFPAADEPSTPLLRGLSEAGVLPGSDAPPVRWVRAVRRQAVVWGCAALLVALFVAWHVTRSSFLTASSIPAATLRLDGRDLGMTPVSGLAVDPGEHELRFEHPRFRVLVRRFRVERGSTYEIERGLEALDPGDPEALLAAARSAGLPRSVARPERAAEEPRPLVVVFPRGRTREAPGSLELWGDGSDLPLSVVLALEPEVPAGSSWAFPVAPTQGPLEIALPAAVRAALVPGSQFQVRVRGPSGVAVTSTRGQVLTAEERVAPERALGRLARAYEAEDPTRGFLEVETLLEADLYQEAWARTQALRARIGPRREVARLGLAVLDRAGLRGLAAWDDWAALEKAGR